MKLYFWTNKVLLAETWANLSMPATVRTKEKVAGLRNHLHQINSI